MRIVGGTYKSRVLFEFKGDTIRPTADKVRESLFNILQNRIYGADFLDLFCGTGAMGIEAMSRGARSVTFNDKSRDSIALTKKNLQKLEIDSGYKISNLDAVTYLSGTIDKFDIIYIGPPYASDYGIQALKVVSRALKDGGIVIYENENPLSLETENLVKTDERKYGRVYLTFFKGV
ncbi:MAG: 16S rRNA (guanine(966)-N(2))-methyltransferase RsmD [Clostridia bacterium]|nr:16S rRNA (guanine(966)-N(2))-methyltransferase RsmD [Clostridia bacterium]